MPRKYIRKTGRAPVPLDVMKRASAAFDDGKKKKERKEKGHKNTD